MSRPVVTVVALAAVIASLAPPAAAQDAGETSVDLTLPNLGEPVRPGDPQNNSVTVRYQWANGFSHENTTVRLEVVDEPPWLNSTFTPSSVEFSTADRGPSGVKTDLVNLTLEVAHGAPAYAEGTATYRAIAEENGVLQEATVETEFRVVAGFRGQIVVSLPMGDNVTAWGGTLTEVPLRIENQANGPLLVDVTVARSPADAQIVPPTEVHVNASNGPGGSNVSTPSLAVRVPWSVSESGPVIVELTPSHATRGTPLRTVEARFQLNGNSALPIPSAEAPLGVAAFALAVLLARRGRRP